MISGEVNRLQKGMRRSFGRPVRDRAAWINKGQPVYDLLCSANANQAKATYKSLKKTIWKFQIKTGIKGEGGGA